MLLLPERMDFDLSKLQKRGAEEGKKKMIINNKKIRNWIKELFDLYDAEEFIIGGHCGICGKWIPDEIFDKYWRWGICIKCKEGK